MDNNKLYDEEYRKQLSTFFKDLRKKERWTFEAVAKAVNVKPNTYYYYEQGKRDMPISVFIDLCRFYKIDYITTFRSINNKVKNIMARKNEKV